MCATAICFRQNSLDDLVRGQLAKPAKASRDTGVSKIAGVLVPSFENSVTYYGDCIARLENDFMHFSAPRREHADRQACAVKRFHNSALPQNNGSGMAGVYVP